MALQEANQSVTIHEQTVDSDADGRPWGSWSARFMFRVAGDPSRWGIVRVPWLGLTYIELGRIVLILTRPIRV